MPGHPENQGRLMPWAGSGVFAAYITKAIQPTAELYGSWIAARLPDMRFALFTAAVTPDVAAPDALAAYGAGQWTLPRECTGPGWPAGGQTAPLARSTGSAPNLDVGAIALGATPGLGPVPSVTLTGICGDLMYHRDGPVAPGGLCFHDFGGSTDVTGGQLSVTWFPWVIEVNDP
jgi:hypothetical protein